MTVKEAPEFIAVVDTCVGPIDAIRPLKEAALRLVVDRLAKHNMQHFGRGDGGCAIFTDILVGQLDDE